MADVVLKAVRRDVIGKQVKALRRNGELPAVIYGHHIQPIPIVLETKPTNRYLTGLAPSALVTIEVEGETHRTLIREKQRHRITGELMHVDFLAVSMTEKLHAHVSVSVTGASPAVKDFNGVLVTGMSELEVECLPEDLPERIVVNISSLVKIGDAIYVRDVVVSDKVKILEEPDTMLVLVTAQAAEEEVVVEAAPIEPEVIEKGKIEEEEEKEK